MLIKTTDNQTRKNMHRPCLKKYTRDKKKKGTTIFDCREFRGRETR